MSADTRQGISAPGADGRGRGDGGSVHGTWTAGAGDGGDRAQHRPTGPGAVPGRSIAALLVAAGLVVVVVVLVLVFGIARPPALPTLAEQPDPAPSASVAWSRWQEGFACVDTLSPDGVVTEVACDLRGEEVVAWDADGIALWVWGPREQLDLLDPVTGEVTDSRPADGAVLDQRTADAINVHRRDGVLTVHLRDTGAVVWEVEAHDNYRIHQGSLSPDGRWVAMFDSADRLLVAPSDGSLEPRVWYEGQEQWQAPVWEGTPLPAGSGD